MPHASKSIKHEMLLSFAVRLRQGYAGKGKRIGAQAVATGLRHVAQNAVLAGYPDPRKSYGDKQLDLPISHLLKTFRDEDPAPQPKLALPVHAIKLTCNQYYRESAPQAHAIGDLITIAFFFLLRVGEYTFPKPGKRKRTTQFRLQDVKFFKNGNAVPLTAPLSMLLQASSVTLTIDRQKNGVRGATVHHHATSSPTFCPVKALARRVHAIILYTQDFATPISLVTGPQFGQPYHIIDRDITAALRYGAAKAGLLFAGYTLERISSHSLRASGAMALKLNGADDTTIQKLGRWSSRTFLMYIHTQISAYAAGWSSKMAKPIHFLHVG